MSHIRPNNILSNIMKNIEQCNNTDELIDIIEKYNKRICNIFNTCDENIQIDFIKLLLIKFKCINEDAFNNILPSLKISNINTINILLEWGCNNNDYALCNFVLNHKDDLIKISPDEYFNYEKKTNGNNDNLRLAYLFTHFRIKDTYDNSDDYNNSDNLSSQDDTSDFDTSSESNFSSSESNYSSSDSSDNNNSSDEEDYDYTKNINPKDAIEVD